MSEKTKKSWKIVFFLIINLALLVIVSTANAEAARLGSSGERVAEIQRKLKESGCYSGEINGSFDFATRQAVKGFQRRNSIEATGETDCRTLFMLGINSSCSDFCIQTELLARFIQKHGGTSYHSMLTAACYTLKAKNELTLIRYIMNSDADFTKELSSDEPSPEAYSAAAAALKKAAP